MVERATLDAGAIVGLLADDERRRVAAAVILGASSADAVVAATGLAAERVSRALGRLADGGLVVDAADGLVVDGDAFQQAARAARARPPRMEHAGESAERRKVLDAFVHDGRITTLPAAHGKRVVVLDWLAQSFEPGVRYPEREVNEILAACHPDTAMLRRYLVDEGLLDRAGGEYWRSGGTVT
jgi:DNA-binding transcriptional ArsR family regulator